MTTKDNLDLIRRMAEAMREAQWQHETDDNGPDGFRCVSCGEGFRAGGRPGDRDCAPGCNFNALLNEASAVLLD